MSFSSENTAPHHLHSLLSRVQGSGKATQAEGWAFALEASWGSVEFAKRHAEVAHLMVATIEQLNALPERARERTLRYVNSWWNSLVQPQLNWTDASRPANNIIAQDMLDHLEAAADLIAGNLVGSIAAPRGVDLDGIAEQCREWLDLLRGMEGSEISGPVRDGLVSQIEHLIWLVENVELFGGARVASEASRVIGSLAQASAIMENANPETVSRWKKGWLALIAVCVAFNGGVAVVQESIDTGTSIVKEITGVVQDVQGP
ncbi:hypothetical protein [Streptomyces sp. NPDC002082]|uniref:hypothetical protein n=1 Tax=Streptomyces sp. NPDC002082 TaxID=3154772 RepID=UPI00332634D0